MPKILITFEQTPRGKFEAEWNDYIDGLIRLDPSLDMAGSKKLIKHIRALKKLALEASKNL